ncbi:hypothetical protein AK830_g10713 [Neonectria ditissima]|uniref:tRNA-intron lyase n=1 Tax=Neonectria ditissima TaxID=78410 RepID=A0A0P7AF43_9HYPO|nr:hypothetical protein AK830_g10713 [Neonectria ditissima]
MAENQPPTTEPGASTPANAARPRPQQRGPPLHEIYSLPVPIRTFPLPAFYPNNPISFLHVAYAWLGQLWSPPPREPSLIYHGVWSSATCSVHITDGKAIRALWEQGFFGKGNLSRSEPNWLKREQVRRGLEEAHVSEILTVQRRQERMRAKWERARLEQEVIQQTRLDEAREAEVKETEAQTKLKTPNGTGESAQPASDPPVSPEKLLALPNSSADILPAKDLDAFPLSNGNGTCRASSDQAPGLNGTKPSPTMVGNGHLSDPNVSSSDETTPLKRRKSVRFSPEIKSTTFQLSDPPSPIRAVAYLKTDEVLNSNGDALEALNGVAPETVEKTLSTENQKVVLVDKEHLQLMPEEAFFLSFGLGVLTVNDPTSGKPLSSLDLLTMFRQHSYFPPRIEPEEPALQPDDKFLLHYSVYHHFRSLGWVPRGGIKFGVDWLLYTRGPVFDHAEFGLIVIPSYSDPLWKDANKNGADKSWQWMHATLRVLSHVTKSLVLVYVDVPPPSKFDEALESGIANALELSLQASARLGAAGPRYPFEAPNKGELLSAQKPQSVSSKSFGPPAAFQPRTVLDGSINGGTPITVSSSPRFVQIEDKQHGGWTRLDAVALRDSCACVKCTDPASGQKNFASTDVPADIEIDQIRLTQDGLGVSFRNDIPRLAEGGHEMTVPWETVEKALDLRAVETLPYPRQDAVYPKTGRTFWDNATIRQRVRKIDYADFMQGDEAFWQTILDLSSLGLVFLKNVPADAASIVAITTRIANIKETFYGRTFDVRAKPDAENVAYTSGYLGLHQDLLYLERPPAIQILHCLENSCSGGESLFSDGLRAGKLLWLQDRSSSSAVDNLARVRIPYHYEKHGHWYRQKRALLDVAHDGDKGILASVFWSPPFQDRFQLPAVDVRAWLEPAQLFDRLINAEDAMYQVKMAAGECVLFDNMRVMHGRRAFDVGGGGARWLRGAYIEREDFVSRVLHVPDALAEAYRGGEAWDRADEDRRLRASPWFDDVKAQLDKVEDGLRTKGALELGEEHYQLLNV